MSLDKFDDIIPIVICEPLGLSLLVFAEIFRSLFLGWCLCDLSKAYLERTLSFRTDVPLANLTGDVTVLPHELGEGGAVLGNGEPTGHSVLAEALAVLAHHQSAAARATGRVGYVGSGETYSLFSKSIDVWCGYIFAVIASDISVA